MVERNIDKETAEDIRMVEYFAIDKENIEKWNCWPERKDIINKSFPELIQAINNLKLAEKSLERIINDISFEYSEG